MPSNKPTSHPGFYTIEKFDSCQRVLYILVKMFNWKTAKEVFTKLFAEGVQPALEQQKRVSGIGYNFSLVFSVLQAKKQTKVTTNSQYDNGGLGENFANTRYNYLNGSVGMSYNSNLGDNPYNNFFVGAASL